MRVHDNGSQPALAIFDLDGTLYPRESYVDLSLDVIARGLVELKGVTPEAASLRVAELRRMMAANWDGTSTTAFVLAEGVDAGLWRQFRSRHLDIAGGLSRDERIVAWVADLRRHLPVALLTNNTRAVAGRIMKKIGFPDRAFDVVVSAEDVGPDPKPSPKAFQTVLNRLAAAATTTWSVGDRYNIDVEPLTQLGGAGVTVSGPDEVGQAVAELVARAGDIVTSSPSQRLGHS